MVQRVIEGVEVLFRLRLQFILLRLKEVLNDGVNQFIQLLLQLCQVTADEGTMFELCFLKKERRDFLL